jgi:hypothetical protein
VSSRSLFRAIAERIALDDPRDAPLQVTILTVKGRRLTFDLLGLAEVENAEQMPATTQQALPDPRGRWLSPEEELIVKALASGEWRTGQEIADATRQPKNNTFYGLLSNLVERDVIESSTRHGYRLLTKPAEEESHG